MPKRKAPVTAVWNTKTDRWEIPAGTSARWAAYSATLPISGMIRSGVLCERPTSARPTKEHGSSCSPTSAAPGKPCPAAGQLLPTPRHSDSNGPGLHGRGGLDLRTAISLLPTPLASEGAKGGPNQRGSSGDLTLSSASVSDSFGKYLPAIHRWERITSYPAPPPTEPTGRGGAHRLSAIFVEWVMGLPPGWVTGLGIPRVPAIAALGNGVVPQQAEKALTDMLDAFVSEEPELKEGTS